MPKNISQKNQLITFTIICLISISVLSGCQSSDTNENENTNWKLEFPFEPYTVSTQIQKTTLTLNQHGCIWCGICTQVAPDNFTMNWRKAVVTSQENITSQQVNSAIENCPVSVIEIIEA